VYDNGDLAEPAILAIEIYSPWQTFSSSSLIDKCERLLAAGVGVCWIILPDTRKAWMAYLARGEPNFEHVVGELTIDIQVLSIKVKLAEMWAALDD